MQLHKVCSHPILFEGPRMHRHKVPLFSRFVTARRYRGKRSPFCGRVWQVGSLSTVSEVGLSALVQALHLVSEMNIRNIGIFYFDFH